MQVAESWAQCINILCVRPDNIGDVLMTTPALRALKEALPECKLTLLTSSAGALIAPCIPEIDEHLTFDVPWVKNDTEADPTAITMAVAMLKAYAFDGAVIFTTYSQNPLPAAMLCYMAGIPQVLGYCRENPYQLISSWVPDPEPLELVRHEVERQLALVKTIGIKAPKDTHLSLQVPAASHASATKKLKTLGVNLARPWLIMHTAASEAKRCYDPKGYITAAQYLIPKGWQIVLTGSSGESAYVHAVATGIGRGAVDASGKLSLEELCAAIAVAPILVSNNTGPVHIAAATGTPVVVLYAQTNPQHTPWQVPSRVLYFPVPATMRSKNRFLQAFPGSSRPQASPKRIVEAVRELSAIENLM